MFIITILPLFYYYPTDILKYYYLQMYTKLKPKLYLNHMHVYLLYYNEPLTIKLLINIALNTIR